MFCNARNYSSAAQAKNGIDMRKTRLCEQPDKDRIAVLRKDLFARILVLK